MRFVTSTWRSTVRRYENPTLTTALVMSVQPLTSMPSALRDAPWPLRAAYISSATGSKTTPISTSPSTT